MRPDIRLAASILSFLLLISACFDLPAVAQENRPQGTGRSVITKVEPSYPALARQYHLSGKVKIEVVVSPDGHVKEAKVLGGSPLLSLSAVSAAKECKYEAGPKETVETIEFVFSN